MTDVLEEHEEEARALVAALMDNNVLELLVQRLTSFNEKVCVYVCVCVGA